MLTVAGSKPFRKRGAQESLPAEIDLIGRKDLIQNGNCEVMAICSLRLPQITWEALRRGWRQHPFISKRGSVAH